MSGISQRLVVVHCVGHQVAAQHFLCGLAAYKVACIFRSFAIFPQCDLAEAYCAFACYEHKLKFIGTFYVESHALMYIVIFYCFVENLLTVGIYGNHPMCSSVRIAAQTYDKFYGIVFASKLVDGKSRFIWACSASYGESMLPFISAKHVD